MKKVAAKAAFQPNPTRIEAKQDATTRAAQDILRHEQTLVAQKTKRLRAARIAREALDSPTPALPKPKSRRS